MGYLNFQGLMLLRKKNMVNGLLYIELDNKVSEGCIFGKQHKEKFSNRTWKGREHLALVHSDLCGLMETMSLGKARYFLIFIDEYSKKTWVYFLQEMFEVFSHFLEFKALVEKHSGLKIFTLRTNNGGEYKSNEFLSYWRENGIKKEFTNSYSPQQNGVAEKKNRTIVEMARSMLKTKSLGNELWIEVVHKSLYTLNRCPTKVFLIWI